MNLAHDPELNFYYYGEEPPHPGMFRKYLTDPKLVAVDVETISLKERIAIGVGVAVSPTMAFYFTLFPSPSSVTPWHLLKDPSVTKLFHNAPFDLLCLREYEISNENSIDTNILGNLLNIRPTRLIDLSSHVYMKYGIWYEVEPAKDFLEKHNAKVMLDAPQEAVAVKCCQDAMATFGVYNFLLPDTDEEYFNTENQLIPILVDMSCKGIPIDQEARAEFEIKLAAEVDYYSSLTREEGFSISSPQQVGYMLAKRGAYNVFKRIPFTRGGKTGKKQLRTDEEILNKMDDPLAAMILAYRNKAKLLSTYIRPWANEDRAYTRFHLDAVTGRISSTDRNMQNIPKGSAREIFVPENGCFTDVDFSQIELRVLANVSGDIEMQYIFDTDGDIHQETADFLGIPRRISKNVNFAMIYGATDNTIAETAHIRDINKARELKQMWFDKWRGAGDWIQTQQEEALRHPYIKTMFGREIRLPTEEEESIDRIMRKAINYPIQGSAAEIMKRALIRCKHLPMCLQVHDEILFDGKVELPQLNDIAELDTPVEIKYLQRWE